MTIQEIVQLLEDRMNNRLEEFVKLGKALKQLTNKGRTCDEPVITRLKVAMAQIIKELEPVKGMILEENPCYTNLFEALTLFYDDLLRESQEKLCEMQNEKVETTNNIKQK